MRWNQFIACLFAALPTWLYSQEKYLGKEFSIGFAPMYYAEKVNNDIFGPSNYQEFIANLDFKARMSKNWFIGVRSQLLHYNKKVAPVYSLSNNVNGLYVQYAFIGSSHIRLNLELSYSYGDHCACEPGQPLYGEDLFYLGGGASIDFQVLKKHPNWWFQLGMLTYHINGYYQSIGSTMPFRFYALIGQWTIPIIGIQYKFGDESIFFRKE